VTITNKAIIGCKDCREKSEFKTIGQYIFCICKKCKHKKGNAQICDDINDAIIRLKLEPQKKSLLGNFIFKPVT